jgi:hypothetical protein
MLAPPLIIVISISSEVVVSQTAFAGAAAFTQPVFAPPLRDATAKGEPTITAVRRRKLYSNSGLLSDRLID